MPRYRTVERTDDVRTAKRIFVIGAGFACCFGILFSRAVAFHLKDNEQLERVALRQYRTAVYKSTKRGKILDSQGREMAIDVTVDSLFANPREVSQPVVVADQLSKILGVNRRKLLSRLSTNRKFVWVKRRASDEEANAAKELDIKGIYTMRESKRFYPNGMLGAAVLGAVGFDAAPLGGVELAYNDELAAREGPGRFRRDARGHLYLSPSESESEPLADIELTIDKTLQFIAERELSNGVKEARAKGGTAVVVDVRTGAILAMANVPTFDPNEYHRYPLEHWRNRAIVDPYEPGSTFKVIIVASALDAGVVTADEIVDCENGRIRIGNDIVRDVHPQGKLAVADVVRVSSNIGAYKVEQRLGRERVYEAIRAFGFGRGSNIELPGESSGILAPSEKWSPLQYATIAFGQGIAATPLQMTMAFAAIANDGMLMQPYVVKRIVDGEGKELRVAQPTIVRRPIRPETAELMRRLLVRVTEEGGTGTLAASVEYPVGGKTGTAQKADPRTGTYAKGRYYSSFVGFAPANDPRVAVYVGIDEPRGRYYYGGQVAGPVFREIVESTLHYLKVPGTRNASPAVEAQLPSASAGDLAVVETAGGEPRQVERDGEDTWRLPDLSGLTMRGVLAAAGDADIRWSFVGTGIAVSQSCAAQSVVNAGAACSVEFRPML